MWLQFSNLVRPICKDMETSNTNHTTNNTFKKSQNNYCRKRHPIIHTPYLQPIEPKAKGLHRS